MPKGLARAFARSVGIKDHHNFPRAMDRNDEVHTVVEDWQPLYNVCWLEKVDKSGTAIDWILIWGQPGHTMQKFYHAASAKWNDLPAWNTSRQAVAPNSRRGMNGFRVSKLPLAASRARLQKEALPELSEVSCKWLAPAECC